ncbi:MAG: hypothetical protein AB3N23_00040 [Paracoccaceae bacterium]
MIRPGDLYRAALAVTDPVTIPIGNARLAARAKADPQAVRDRRAAALTRGIEWFKQQRMIEVSGLMLLQATYEAGLDNRLSFIEDAIARYRAENPGFRERLFDPSFAYDPTQDPYGLRYRDENSWQVFEHPLDTIMRRCLYSDRLGLGAEFLEELKSLEDGGGYGTTHAIVGGRLLLRFSNIEAGAIRAVMQETAPRIAAANRGARHGDLFAERILVLQWLGRDDLIDPVWIERMTVAQLDDGGWGGKPLLRGPVANQHTTAIAVTVLAQDLTGRIVPEPDRVAEPAPYPQVQGASA